MERIISILLIIAISLSIQGCLDDGDDNETGYDYLIHHYSSGTVFQPEIQKSEVISSEPGNFIIDVEKGTGLLSDENQEIYESNLAFRRIMIEEDFLRSMLLPDELREQEPDLLQNIEVGNTFSFKVRSRGMDGGFRDNVTLRDGSDLKFHYQRHSETVDLGADGKIEIEHEDVLNAPFDVNETQIIRYHDQGDLPGTFPKIVRYWYPFKDRMLELTDEEVDADGYYIIKNAIFETDDFYYDSYLKFTYSGGSLNLTDDSEPESMYINGNEYYITPNLYKWTLFERYGYFDGPSIENNAFYITRI